MKLKVTGVETIVITDPARLIRHRKHLDPAILQELRGQVLTTDELKGHFGYARTTALADTQLARHIELVDDKRRVSITASRARWRVL